MYRIWGLEKIRLSPFYFNSLRLYYALAALKGVSGKVLELGSGAGAFTRAIKDYRSDLSLLGSDVDPELIELARKLDKESSFVRVDAQEIPFKDGSFNAVLAFDVVEHLKSPEKMLREVFRVLKKGGRVHLAIPLEKSPFTIHGLASRLGIIPKRKYGDHINSFSVEDIIKILNRTGYRRISWKFSGHLFYQLMDFSYFFLLSLFKKKPAHTVEGYKELLPWSFWKANLTLIVATAALISYLESYFLARFPGQIGHFSATKI